MSIGARKKVTVQYRKLDDKSVGFGTRTFQEMVAACLKQTYGTVVIGDDPKARQFNDDGYGTIALNWFEEKTGYFFGELVRFEPGADLALLQISSGGHAYNLTQAKAPDGHEPLRGVLYFMAIRNHVVLIESDMSAARAERYFTWLLSDRTTNIAKGSHVILLAELNKSGGAMQLTNVEQVIFRPKSLSGPSDFDENSLSDKSTTSVVSTTRRGVSETSAFEVLRAAGMDDTDLQRFVSKDTQLEVTIQIKFKDQRYRKPVSIDDTNRLLRNIPDDELTLVGPGGRQKNGKIEKLAYPANVETVGSLLVSKDVARALYEGYTSFLNNGYIDG